MTHRMYCAHPCIGRDVTQPEYAAGAGRAFMQFHELQAYLEGDRMVILRHDLPPASFEIRRSEDVKPIPEGDPTLERKALAHALWGPMTIRDKAYFSHKDSRWPSFDSRSSRAIVGLNPGDTTEGPADSEEGSAHAGGSK